MHKAKAVTIRPGVSAGVAASCPPPKTFQFVTENPASEAERSQNKVLVRSNASNFYWRRVKRTTSAESSAPSTGSSSRRHSRTRNSQSKASRATFATPNPQNPASPSTEGEWWTPRTDESQNGHGTGSNIDEEMVFTNGSLSSLVVSGHHDPFETYPCDLPKEFVSQVLNQINGFLSLMFPPQRGRSISPFAETWLRTTLSDRGLFHASLFCQLMRNRMFPTSSALNTREQMHCYTETIRGVHQKFQDTSISCEDENILSVYALSYHGDLRSDPPAVAPSQGPLTTLQLLHIYGGRLKAVQVHLQGLAKMLNLRGGLSKIKLPGLALAISFGDIVMACQTLSRPMLPYVSMHEDDDVIAFLNIASRKNHPLVGLGRGFRILAQMLSHNDVTRLLVVLRWTIQYTFAVDDHVANRPEAQPLSVLMDERNFVQHNLMHLTPQVSEAHLEHSMHRLSRLATVIYSLLVVFPLPAIAAPFHRLARDIKAQLSEPSVRALWTDASDLILWVTAMGAIAAIGSPDRPWYLMTLDRLTRQLGIDTWSSMKKRLKMFLWFEYTNDSDGLKLWREVEELSLFRLSE